MWKLSLQSYQTNSKRQLQNIKKMKLVYGSIVLKERGDEKLMESVK